MDTPDSQHPSQKARNVIALVVVTWGYFLRTRISILHLSPQLDILPFEMPTINPIPDGAHLNLHPATPSRSIGKRPAPKAADLAPWTFQYASSPDGKDINLLIMFHGLGMSL